MKLTFRGWQRETRPHNHPVTPVRKTPSGSFKTDASAPGLVWIDATTAYGKVNGLALSGSFLVHFNAEHADMEGWLAAFVKSNPEEALRLLAKMQAEAMIQLSKPQEL